MLLTIDIETIPGQSKEARAIAQSEETWRKQALDPAMGELCAVGFAYGIETPAVSVVRQLDETERDFIKRALQFMQTTIEIEYGPFWHECRRPFPVAHNAAFDFGFLRARCWANRICPPQWLPKADACLGRDYGDTMQEFAGVGGRISLSKLCRCLGIANPKETYNGRDVLMLWLQGQHDELAAYNRADVEATRSCWLIMNLSYGCEVI